MQKLASADLVLAALKQAYHAEMGARLQKNIPVYKDMVAERAKPPMAASGVTTPKKVRTTFKARKAVQKVASWFKAANIRAAMPWLQKAPLAKMRPPTKGIIGKAAPSSKPVETLLARRNRPLEAPDPSIGPKIRRKKVKSPVA